MKRIFPFSTPEAQGIPSQALLNFHKSLDLHRAPLHSALFMRNGHVVSEAYSAPFTEDTLHRMFSITKSFVSLAIGLLQEEGKLRLDDPVVNYFADKVQGKEIHPYIREATIRDLLRMASPHTFSSYKLLYGGDWEDKDMSEAFFITPPSHRPGMCFAYDTSATHVLGALAERVSGMELIGYLRKKFLDELHFSENAYILKNDFGESLGGSGLMAAPYDLLRVMQVIMQGGQYQGKQLLPADYLQQATSWQIDNYAKPPSDTLEETFGYGYKFWLTRENGFACYGMGGQLCVCFPEKQLIFVTTADVQDIKGGVQLIYDAFFTEVWPFLSDEALAENPAAHETLQAYCAGRVVPCVPGKADSPVLDEINGVRWVLDDNPMGFRSIMLRLDGTQGVLTYEKKDGTFSLPFAVGTHWVGSFPDRGFRCASSGAFRTDNTFVIKAQLIEVSLGNVTFELVFRDNSVTLLMHKIEETMFNDYTGAVTGYREV